jgi:hypothetical protein
MRHTALCEGLRHLTAKYPKNFLSRLKAVDNCYNCTPLADFSKEQIVPSNVNDSRPAGADNNGITTSGYGCIAVTDDSARENVARNTGNSLNARPDVGIRRIGGQLSTKLSTILVETCRKLRNGGVPGYPPHVNLSVAFCAKSENCGEG